MFLNNITTSAEFAKRKRVNNKRRKKRRRSFVGTVKNISNRDKKRHTNSDTIRLPLRGWSNSSDKSKQILGLINI